jgi:hypothetical protein
MRKLHELRAAQTWTEVSRGVCIVPTGAFYAGSPGNRKIQQRPHSVDRRAPTISFRWICKIFLKDSPIARD